MCFESYRNYQLALRTPGISPLSAKLRKQIRQMPNLRYTARGRPHILQRRTMRVENFGVRADFAICPLVATTITWVLNERKLERLMRHYY
jgi:hypothetical protein